MSQIATDGVNTTYAYDADGIRSAKTVGSTVHTYLTQNGRVMRETIRTNATETSGTATGASSDTANTATETSGVTTGTNGSNVTDLATGTNSGTANTAAETSSSTTATVLDFIYDESGRPFALNYSTDNGNTFTTYYYVLNLQGDVVKLVTSSGSAVATYTYDAWGNILTASGALATINPLRYRGYYYDSETDFYYLQSRYYDPANHRFLSIHKEKPPLSWRLVLALPIFTASMQLSFAVKKHAGGMFQGDTIAYIRKNHRAYKEKPPLM